MAKHLLNDLYLIKDIPCLFEYVIVCKKFIVPWSFEGTH